MLLERFALFIIPIACLLVAETMWPKRDRGMKRQQRWPSAVFLLAIGTVVSRLVAPAGLIGVALWAEQTGTGILNGVDVPSWLALLLVFVLFDFGVWLQHVVLHKVPFLWRFHRVHHTDIDFDVTTALRFHPGEILLSFAWKTALVIALGAPPIAVLVFEVALNVCAMFNHANLALPTWLDRRLRLVLVTPDMHRVHHSTTLAESQRNFGFCLPWWDRLFGVYQEMPAAGHTEMEIGQSSWREAQDHSLVALLRQPLEPHPESVKLR